VARAAAIAGLAHEQPLAPGELADVRRALADVDARVRAAAIGALARRADPDLAFGPWCDALRDHDASVRRRAAELGAALASARCVARLLDALDDRDVTVVEAAAWSLGELADATTAHPGAVVAIGRVATGHRDALAREAAVAALGALGDPRGLPAVLHATEDKPAVRRRAVLALAPFEGDDVDTALARALADRDWQVRQAAEDLTNDA
jgi:HEAT repeat protein